MSVSVSMSVSMSVRHQLTIARSSRCRFVGRYRLYSSTHPKITKTVLILGSNGVLGSTLARHLKDEHGCHTIGADTSQPTAPTSLTSFVLVSPTDTAASLLSSVPTDRALDAIVCTNGGYEPDDPGGTNGPHERMMAVNHRPVVAASSLLSTRIAANGLFVATGATSALAPSPPPGTAYGTSKAAVHHFINSLGVATGTGLGGSRSVLKSTRAVEHRRRNEYLDTLTVAGVLPSVIYTEHNRETMGTEGSELWTPPIDIAREIGRWVMRPELRPHSGSLVKVLTRKVRGAKHNTGKSVYETEFHLVR